MMDQKCCENCDNCNNCGCSHGRHGDHGHGMWTLDCCVDHKMSKGHLEMKKKMLEDKLEWVNGELAKK